MIKFTQYLLPNGERREVEIEVPADIQEQADYLIAAGQKFEAEILRTGAVSLTWEPRDEELENRFFIKLCGNNDNVSGAVHALVTKAYNAIKAEDAE